MPEKHRRHPCNLLASAGLAVQRGEVALTRIPHQRTRNHDEPESIGNQAGLLYFFSMLWSALIRKPHRQNANDR
jgi:hypothetical protein